MSSPVSGPVSSPASASEPSLLTAKRIAIAIAVVLLIAVPYAISETYYVNIASQILLYAIFALGLNVLVGYAGLVDRKSVV